MTVIFLLGSDRGARNGDWVITFPLLILGCFHLWGLIEKKVLKTKAISPRVFTHKSFCPSCARPPSRSERQWGWSSTESILLARREKITVQELDLFSQLKWMQLCLSIALRSDQDRELDQMGGEGESLVNCKWKCFNLYRFGTEIGKKSSFFIPLEGEMLAHSQSKLNCGANHIFFCILQYIPFSYLSLKILNPVTIWPASQLGYW